MPGSSILLTSAHAEAETWYAGERLWRKVVVQRNREWAKINKAQIELESVRRLISFGTKRAQFD